MLVWIMAGLVGLSLGLLGAGGSILALPILRYVAGLPIKQAVATSLAAVGAVSALGVLVAHKQGRVHFKSLISFSLLASIGSLVGVRLALVVHEKAQMAGFLLILVGAYLAMGTPQTSTTSSPLSSLSKALGVGLLSGLVGVGGGFLIVPSLTAIYSLTVRQATGTSLAVITLNSLTALAAYHGNLELDYVITTKFVAAALLGMLVGLRIGRVLDDQATSKVFRIMLALVAVLVLVKEFLLV